MRRRRSGRRGSQKSENEVVPEKPKSKLIDAEEAATGGVGWDVYLRYAKSIGVALGFTAIISNALMQASSVYSGSKSIKSFYSWLETNKIYFAITNFFPSLAYKMVY